MQGHMLAEWRCPAGPGSSSGAMFGVGADSGAEVHTDGAPDADSSQETGRRNRGRRVGAAFRNGLNKWRRCHRACLGLA